MKLVECVPNFSEGRDASRVDAIVAAIQSVAGVAILDREMDADHNRCVITFVAAPESVGEAAIRGVAKAVELIDLTKHTGAHPRIGAADVVPFVPIEGVTLDDCVAIAWRVGEELWRRLRVPVYFYEAAAKRPYRRNLEDIRKGQFEGLREEIATDPLRQPDFGDPRVHPTAGATVVGARKFLIAYNINLNTPDVQIAKTIAKTIRASSGGMACVKAMGVDLKARGLAQVSMNLTDFEQTPVHAVFHAVAREAAKHGARIAGSEIIGLIPKRALELAAAAFLNVENWDPNLILENRMAAVLGGRKQSLRAKCEAFVDAVAAPSATPGGGSVAALAGSLAAALGQMVAGLSHGKKASAQHEPELLAASARLQRLVEELKQAIDRDAASYENVRAAYKLPKEDEAARIAAIQRALRGAAEVPLEVFERAREITAIIEQLVPITSPAMASDLKVARFLAAAAAEGARANVQINMEGITDAEYVRSLQARLGPVTD